jgi:hypothetical protein
LTQQDGVVQLTRIQFFQQLLARLGWSRILRLRGRGHTRQTNQDRKSSPGGAN